MATIIIIGVIFFIALQFKNTSLLQFRLKYFWPLFVFVFGLIYYFTIYQRADSKSIAAFAFIAVASILEFFYQSRKLRVHRQFKR